MADSEDPLVAALPPATDYLTYLTLLEYQLTTQNLSTLNRLLGEDDGTLAAEIGWDLLKMVLPMLQLIPEEANRCLETIARRGNPREVIVRVAEELELLGHQDASDDVSEDDQEELPTFAGEATRIHLGQMKLDGMPDLSAEQPAKIDAATGMDVGNENAESGSDDNLSLRALISMLGILHPRIKTQHPSRFLATSLPAALGAYRRLPMTDETTSNFIDFLGRLSGKQRPALPPRTSTSGSAASLLVGKHITASTTVPLPDPEAKSEEALVTEATQVNEKAIIQRLLQAVLLEVVDEYTNSLIAHDMMQMKWTNRLREKIEPGKIVPGRPSLSQLWNSDPILEERDRLMKRFVKLAKDLSLDIQVSIEQILESKKRSKDSQRQEEGDSDIEEKGNDDDDAGATEYPQTPADIPLSLSALIVLQAAEKFYTIGSSQTINLPEKLTHLSDLDDLALTHVSPVTDAVLSLIYSRVFEFSAQSLETNLSQVDILNSLAELKSIFVSNPDASIRDNAYHIASMVIHRIADKDTKLTFIKTLLKHDSSDKNAIMSLQSGNLKSIAVNWLKDEFLSSIRPANPPPNATIEPLSPETLSTDTELRSLLLPSLPSMPGPFISSHPPQTKPATSDESSMQLSTETDLESFLLHIPFYISSLNLITVLSSISLHHDKEAAEEPLSTASQADSIQSPPPPPPPSTLKNDTSEESVLTLTTDLQERAESFVQSLQTWSAGLTSLLEARSSTTPNNDGLQLSDTYALEDAVNRASVVLSTAR